MPSDAESLQMFEPASEKGMFLAEYLRRYALADEEEHVARTYLLRDVHTGEIAYYFSLKAGFVSYNEKGIFRRTFDSVPGIELMNYAANGAYKKAHPTYSNIGLGSIVFEDFILPKARDASAIIGAKMIYLFALPQKRLIETYQSHGFTCLPYMLEKRLHRRIKPRYDQGCIFMYQTL